MVAFSRAAQLVLIFAVVLLSFRRWHLRLEGVEQPVFVAYVYFRLALVIGVLSPELWIHQSFLAPSCLVRLLRLYRKTREQA